MAETVASSLLVVARNNATSDLPYYDTTPFFGGHATTVK